MLSKLFRVAILLPALYWGYLIYAGEVGADPAKTLNHKAGDIALYYLLLNLAIGALISFSFRFPPFLRFLLVNRRFLGVVTFLYLVGHLFFYLVMEGLEPQAFTQIFSKLYLALGFSAWLILLLLALTSNNFSVRRLGGRRWKLIHRSVYVASALATVHVLLIEKADLVKFGILFALLWIVMLARLARFCWRRFGPIARERA